MYVLELLGFEFGKHRWFVAPQVLFCLWLYWFQLAYSRIADPDFYTRGEEGMPLMLVIPYICNHVLSRQNQHASQHIAKLFQKTKEIMSIKVATR